MKKSAIITTAAILAIPCLAAPSGGVETMQIKLPAPKIFAQTFFSLMNKSSQNKQTNMELQMMAGIIGYPHFSGISPTDPVGISFVRQNGELAGYAELSAKQNAPIISQLNNLFKISRNGDRVSFQFSGEKSPLAPADVKFDDTPATSFVEARTSTPRILSAFAGLPQNSEEALDNFSEFSLKLDEGADGLLLDAKLAAKENSEYARSVASMRAGCDFAKMLPSGGALVVSSKVSFAEHSSVELELSGGGTAAIFSDGNFALSASLGAAPSFSAVMRAWPKSADNLQAQKIYQIKSVGGARLGDMYPQTPVYALFDGGIAVFSTDKSELKRMLAKAKAQLSARAPKPNIDIFVNSETPSQADIALEKRGLSIKMSVPFKMLGGFFGAAKQTAYRHGSNL